MDSHSILTFTLVAAIAIASPGPATLMAINNSLAHGQRSTIWSSLGNASGLFCLSAAAMLGLGALLASSELLFNAVKIIGAGYLFYLGVKQLFKKGPMLPEGVEGAASTVRPTRGKLYKSAFLTAVTNPKATMLFCSEIKFWLHKRKGASLSTSQLMNQLDLKMFLLSSRERQNF